MMIFTVTYVHETQCDVPAATIKDALSVAHSVCAKFPGGACKVLSIYREGSQPLPPPGAVVVVVASTPKKGLADHIGDEFRKNHPHLFPPDSA
jgi:hypothetical protein